MFKQCKPSSSLLLKLGPRTAAAQLQPCSAAGAAEAISFPEIARLASFQASPGITQGGGCISYAQATLFMTTQWVHIWRKQFHCCGEWNHRVANSWYGFTLRGANNELVFIGKSIHTSSVERWGRNWAHSLTAGCRDFLSPLFLVRFN